MARVSFFVHTEKLIPFSIFTISLAGEFGKPQRFAHRQDSPFCVYPSGFFWTYALLKKPQSHQITVQQNVCCSFLFIRMLLLLSWYSFIEVFYSVAIFSFTGVKFYVIYWTNNREQKNRISFCCLCIMTITVNSSTYPFFFSLLEFFDR